MRRRAVTRSPFRPLVTNDNAALAARSHTSRGDPSATNPDHSRDSRGRREHRRGRRQSTPWALAMLANPMQTAPMIARERSLFFIPDPLWDFEI